MLQRLSRPLPDATYCCLTQPDNPEVALHSPPGPGRWLETLTEPTVCVAHGGTIRSLFHLVGGVPGVRAAEMDIHQGRLLRLEGDRLEWL